MQMTIAADGKMLGLYSVISDQFTNSFVHLKAYL